MGLNNVLNKFDELEVNGFLEPIDDYDRNEYTKDKIIRRSIEDSDEETFGYLVSKIRNFLKDERVIFTIFSNRIYIIPHKEIEGVLESNSYIEMKNKLKNVKFIHVNNYIEDKGLKVSGPYYFRLVLKHILENNNAINYTENINNNYGSINYYLTSDKCENRKSIKKEIDKLF